MTYQYVFGPVLSRRLGISLGVDLIPFKTCSMDCVYCECGQTTNLTLERKEYVPIADVLKELDDCLSKKPELNYITFSGGGEPTLNSGIGSVVKYLKTNYPQYKICLLTNSFALGEKTLLDDIKNVDLVIPSLDASNEEEFAKINKPPPSLKLNDVIDSLITFRHASKALFWLELFIVPGINDSKSSAEAFAKIIDRIKPDKVQLNSLDRPPALSWVKSADEDTVAMFRKCIEKICPAESIGKVIYKKPDHLASSIDNPEPRILKLITKRPCTLEDIAFVLRLESPKLLEILKSMEEKKLIKTEERKRGRFYRAVSAQAKVK